MYYSGMFKVINAVRPAIGEFIRDQNAIWKVRNIIVRSGAGIIECSVESVHLEVSQGPRFSYKERLERIEREELIKGGWKVEREPDVKTGEKKGVSGSK